jgi:hypothetical protein
VLDERHATILTMAKLDPRADPVSNPPSAKDDFSVDRVAVPKDASAAAAATAAAAAAVAKKTSDAESESFPALELESSVVPVDKSSSDRRDDAKADAKPDDDSADKSDDDLADKPRAAERPAKKITSRDPRYEPLEKLLDTNDWKKIAAEVGPMDDVGKLPPNLGLLAALAHNEISKDGNPDAAAAAIRCMAGLLGVDEDSPIARVLARRMLRKNPVKLSERQAPPARTSFLIVVITLVLGGGVGFVASAGSWNAIAHMLHLR